MKKPNPYVQCFYCEEMLKRPQGRAAHIRKAHAGAPYRPSPEQIAEYKAKHQPAAHPPTEVSQPAAPPAVPLTPRGHLVAAISEIKEQLEATRRQIPALETQLDGLRAAQVRMEQDLGALDTALASIGGTDQSQLQLDAVPPAEPTARPEPQSEARVSTPPRRHSPPRSGRGLAAGAPA
jgi:hypothetical protein